MVQVSDFDRFVFIVGAPRCGTTTYSRFLKDHPSIAFPVIKEPHFFSRHDLRGLSLNELRRTVERDFLAKFYVADPDRRVGADGSVTYLYSPELLEPILKLWPNSKFIVGVRDPLRMLPSLHRRLLYVGQEVILTFADAWAAVPARAAGRDLPASCFDPRLLRYDEAARFGTYVERLFSVVGRDSCQVLVLDDLNSDAHAQYLRMMEFCGLEPQADVNLSPQRQGQSVRSRRLQQLLKQPPRRVLETAGDALLERHRRLKQGRSGDAVLGAIMTLRKRLLRWNAVPGSVDPLPPILQDEISRYLVPEMAKLGELTGRDFSHWLSPSAAVEPVPLPPVNASLTPSYRGAYSR